MDISQKSQDILLYFLKNKRKSYPTQLAKELEIPSPTALRSLNKLEEQGLVKRDEEIRTNAIKLFKITERGKKLAREINKLKRTDSAKKLKSKVNMVFL